MIQFICIKYLHGYQDQFKSSECTGNKMLSLGPPPLLAPLATSDHTNCQVQVEVTTTTNLLPVLS